MANNNENEAIGTDEHSAEVAHKIGVEMGLWRMKPITINRQHLLVLEAYIQQLEKRIDTNYIDITQIYRNAEDLVYQQAMIDATNKVMNQ